MRHQGYNKRGSKKAGRGLIPNRMDIDERPKIVEEKIRFNIRARKYCRPSDEVHLSWVGA